MEIKQSIISGNNYYFLIQKGIQIGKCIVNKKSNKIAHLKYMQINSPYRGNQYSTKFWNLVEQSILEEGFEQVTLETDEFDYGYNKLVNLYKSWGFKVSGKERFVYNGDFLMRRVPMTKKL